MADRQREIDTAECNVAAMQAVPSPQMPALPPSPVPQSYSVSGTATTYDANGNAHTGYYSGRASSEGSAFDPAKSMMEGAAAAQFGHDSYQSNVARRQFAEACMLRRGWTKAMAGQQPNLTAIPASTAQPPPATATPRVQSATPTSTAVSPTTAPYQSFDGWQKGHGN
jgi:hypothetical protein